MDVKVDRSAASGSAAKDPKSEKSKKPKPKANPTHPPVAKMVNKAIESLNEKGGSSVRAIKKYVAANYVVDPEKVSHFIKKYLAKAVENKILLQTKGKGFTGSFKIAPDASKKKESVKKHVTASGTTKEDAKGTKSVKKSSLRGRKPTSKQQSREGSRKSMERKTSKMSTVSKKTEKRKA